MIVPFFAEAPCPLCVRRLSPTHQTLCWRAIARPANYSLRGSVKSSYCPLGQPAAARAPDWRMIVLAQANLTAATAEHRHILCAHCAEWSPHCSLLKPQLVEAADRLAVLGADVLLAMVEADVPAGRICTVADIARDPHYRARNAVTSLTSARGLQVEMPAVFPLLSANPGSVRQRAPTLGEHTDAVLEAAGLRTEQLAQLRAQGVIA